MEKLISLVKSNKKLTQQEVIMYVNEYCCDNISKYIVSYNNTAVMFIKVFANTDYDIYEYYIMHDSITEKATIEFVNVTYEDINDDGSQGE